MKHSRVVLGCHAGAGQTYLARFAGESGQNGLAAPCIDALLRVVPPCFAALQRLQISGRQQCFLVIVP